MPIGYSAQAGRESSDIQPSEPSPARKPTFLRLICGILFVLAALLVPASTVRYWEAWLFAAVLFIPMTLFAIHLLRHHPQLMETAGAPRICNVLPEGKISSDTLDLVNI